MKKYTTIDAALSAITDHPSGHHARCIVRSRKNRVCFFAISIASIDQIRWLQSRGAFPDIAFEKVVMDFADIPVKLARDKKKYDLYLAAQKQIVSAEYCDPEGIGIAAKKCIDILMAGGSASKAKAALNERHPHPGWI